MVASAADFQRTIAFNTTAELGPAVEDEASGPAWASPLEPGRILAGQYRLERLLARGGMATVFEATQIALDRKVAVKVLAPGMAAGPVSLQRFELEARTAARLQHPNIVAVHGFGTLPDGGAFIVMELVAGPTLRRFLDLQGPLPWRTALRISIQVASASAAAHARGIIHCDLSASNVLLEEGGDRLLHCKLADFGISRSADAPAGTRPALGTPRYAAPELYDGRPASVRTDVYALGALMREMVGEQPDALPAAFEALIAESLDPDPQRRPRDAQQVVESLRAIARRAAAREPPRSEAASPAGEVLYADPADALWHRESIRRGSVSLRRTAMVIVAMAGTGMLALVAALLIEMRPAAEPAPLARPPPEPPVAIGVQLAEVRSSLPLRAPQVSFPVDPPPRVARPRVAAPPVTRPPVPVAVPAAQEQVAPVPESTPPEEPRAFSADDERLARSQLVAALDQWLHARNLRNRGVQPQVSELRLGQPEIAFDPSGRSARMTYRKQYTIARAERIRRSEVTERLFWSRPPEGTWRLVER